MKISVESYEPEVTAWVKGMLNEDAIPFSTSTERKRDGTWTIIDWEVPDTTNGRKVYKIFKQLAKEEGLAYVSTEGGWIGSGKRRRRAGSRMTLFKERPSQRDSSAGPSNGRAKVYTFSPINNEQTAAALWDDAPDMPVAQGPNWVSFDLTQVELDTMLSKLRKRGLEVSTLSGNKIGVR